MSESLFSFTTKVAGDLLTVRGNSYDEFATNVATLVHNSQQIITDLTLLQGASNAAPLYTPEPAAPPAPPAPTPPAPPAQQWQQGPAPAAPPQQWGQQPQQQAGHNCDCGLPMRLRNSQYGSFYSCPKNMQDPTRCNKKINA